MELHLHWSIATSFPLTSHRTPSPLEHSYILSTYISPNSISTGAYLHSFHLHLTELHLHWSIAISFPLTSHRTLSPLEHRYILSIYISRNSISTAAYLHSFHLHLTELQLHWSIATYFPCTSQETPSPLEHSYILSIYISLNSTATGTQLHPFFLHLAANLSLADVLRAILAALNTFYSPIWSHYTILSTDRLPYLIHTPALCPNYCNDHSKSTGNSHFLRRTYCWYWQIEWNLKFILKRQ